MAQRKRQPTGLIINDACIQCDVPVFNWLDTGLEFKVGRGARRRHPKKPVDLGVLHWTGGENPPRTLFRVLTGRELGVEFALDRDGIGYQFADPAKVDTFDAGKVNPRSWGMEIINYGWRPKRKPERIPRKGRGRETYDTRLHGRKMTLAAFTPAQIEAAIELTTAINQAMGIPCQVPKTPAGKLITRALKPKELRRFKGVVGHYHITPKKIDPGTDLLEAMIEAGY